MNIKELEDKANYIRDEVIRVACKNNLGHIAPSLSTVDILVALYYQIMNPFALRNELGEHYALKNGAVWQERDRLILSKGHGCYALYAILVDLGIIPRTYYEDDVVYGEDALKGCVEYKPYRGLEASTGSLGHGLPIAVGIALALKKKESKAKVYCILGDGECQEGTTWESLNFASEHNLFTNLKVIVDENRLMALESVKLNERSIRGIHPKTVCEYGHNMEDIIKAIKEYDIIFALTEKGYGLKCMEGEAKFHYRVPTEDELKKGRTY